MDLLWLYEFLDTLFIHWLLVHCVMCSDLRKDKDIQKVERKKHFFVNELHVLNRTCSGNEKSLPRCCVRAWRLEIENCIVNDFVFRGFGGVLSREGFVSSRSYVISEVRHHDTIFLPKTKGFQNFRRVYPIDYELLVPRNTTIIEPQSHQQSPF